MKKSSGLIHSLFWCEDCGAKFETYRNAQALAAKHAKKYGHLVRGEVGISIEYNGS